VAGDKIVNGCQYRTIARARAIIEAKLNNLTPEAYRSRLNAGDLNGLVFLNKSDHVHHENENESDDRLENLIVLCGLEHMRQHALERHNNLRYVATEDLVASIEPVGPREVFDIKMDGQFHNFVADSFITHNSGKSTMAMTGMAHAINRNDSSGCGLYVDLECAVRDHYAMKLGVDFRPPEVGGSGQAIRVQPHTFEETESLVMTAALQGVDFIVIDSVAGLVSSREVKRDTSDEEQKLGVAEIPRLMSGWMPKIQSVIARTGTHVMFLNQTRDKIGASKMAKSEEALKTTTGGNALKFWASLRMMLKPRMSAKAKLWNPLTRQKEDIQISTDVEVKMIKNKIDATQGHSGMITIRYGVGIDELRTMLNVAQAYKVIAISKNKKKQDVYKYASGGGTAIEVIGIERFRLELTKHQLINELVNRCTENILQGFKMLDDEQLAQLAEDAVSKREGDDDDYETDEDPEVVSVDGVTMNEEGEVEEPAVPTPEITSDMIDD
jgi:recombination protein RecA